MKKLILPMIMLISGCTACTTVKGWLKSDVYDANDCFSMSVADGIFTGTVIDKSKMYYISQLDVLSLVPMIIVVEKAEFEKNTKPLDCDIKIQQPADDRVHTMEDL